MQYVNFRFRRSGTLWEGRHKSSLICAELHLLTCMRYIELNPVRAMMVAHPADYRWSSFRHNAVKELDPLITPHPVYLGLAADTSVRRSAYRKLFETALDSGEFAEHSYRLDVLNASWQ